MMNNIALTRSLQSQRYLVKGKNKDWTNYNGLITLAVGSGLFFVILGLALQVIFFVADPNNSALNYAGVGSLVTAFIFLGVSAHFMDKSDENERQYKRSGIKKFSLK